MWRFHIRQLKRCEGDRDRYVVLTGTWGSNINTAIRRFHFFKIQEFVEGLCLVHELYFLLGHQQSQVPVKRRSRALCECKFSILNSKFREALLENGKTVLVPDESV